ncbi:hypothetical protein D3C80_853980 [compost metagenome]
MGGRVLPLDEGLALEATLSPPLLVQRLGLARELPCHQAVGGLVGHPCIVVLPGVLDLGEGGAVAIVGGAGLHREDHGDAGAAVAAHQGAPGGRPQLQLERGVVVGPHDPVVVDDAEDLQAGLQVHAELVGVAPEQGGRLGQVVPDLLRRLGVGPGPVASEALGLAEDAQDVGDDAVRLFVVEAQRSPVLARDAEVGLAHGFHVAAGAVEHRGRHVAGQQVRVVALPLGPDARVELVPGRAGRLVEVFPPCRLVVLGVAQVGAAGIDAHSRHPGLQLLEQGRPAGSGVVGRLVEAFEHGRVLGGSNPCLGHPGRRPCSRHGRVRAVHHGLLPGVELASPSCGSDQFQGVRGWDVLRGEGLEDELAAEVPEVM